MSLFGIDNNRMQAMLNRLDTNIGIIAANLGLITRESIDPVFVKLHEPVDNSEFFVNIKSIISVFPEGGKTYVQCDGGAPTYAVSESVDEVMTLINETRKHADKL